MTSLVGRVLRKVRDILLYIDFRLRRRRHIKKAKREDSNIYPFW